MAYQALYRKWRPLTFDDVIGQSHITDTLKNEITENRLAHAYLFTGTRGTGKTSTAKILSRAVNCPHSVNGNPCNECEICTGILSGAVLDIIEIDAASNTGVDNIREIIEQCQYASASTKYKVYIIDEVHMLSSGAFNALLKTLEEPPAHVIFILATTEIHAVPATILSRCQRFDFSTISTADLVSAMSRILENEGISAETDALEYVAYLGNGSMRDSLSILDRCIAFKSTGITYDDVVGIVGALDDTYLYQFARYIAANDTAALLSSFDQCVAAGKSLDNFSSDMLNCYRELLKFMIIGKEYKTSARRYKLICETVTMYTQEKLVRCIYLLTDLVRDLKFVSNPRVLIECTLIKMANPAFEVSEASILDRIAAIEKKLASGAFVQQSQPAEQPKAPAMTAEEEYAMFGDVPPEEPSYDVPPIPGDMPAQQESSSEPAGGQQPASGDPAIINIINNWSDIITEVQKSNQLVMYLHISLAVPRAQGNSLVLMFEDQDNKNSFDKTAEKAKLADIIESVTGKHPEIICILKDEADFKEAEQSKADDIFANLAAQSDAFPENIKID
ncbi:MAG: DNA polymerase III subunit gamma/tau [Clostridia bacterium]|nr:DNA polymerase III subunit gamma/tau [Clostridia bacterium]